MTCPLCKKIDHFYINKDIGLWDCKSCGEKGHFNQLRQQLGDASASISSIKPPVCVSPLPNLEVTTSALSRDEKTQHYLINERKLRVDVVNQFKLGVAEKYFSRPEGNHKALVIPYLVKGKQVYAKFRTLPPTEKGFTNSGGSIEWMYNQDAIRNDQNELVICEAELDALSLISAGYESVVALPGATTQKAPWLSLLDEAKIKKIVLCFDNDKAGQEGAKKLANRIGLDKCYNLVLQGVKDLNEFFIQGQTLEDFIALKDQSRKFELAGVKSVAEVLENLSNECEMTVLRPPIDSPWQSLNKLIGGVQYGHLVGIVGDSGVGKTTFAMNWLDYIADTLRLPAFLLCLEMPIVSQVIKFASYRTETPYDPDQREAMKQMFAYTKKQIARYEADLFFGYTQFVHSDEIFELMRMATRLYGCKAVALDNLQILVGELEHYVQQTNNLSKRMKKMAMELNIALFEVIQPKKPDDHKITTLNDARGSIAQIQDMDTGMAIHRNRKVILTPKDFQMTGGQVYVPETFDSKMLVMAGKTRYAMGGMTTLEFHGDISKVTELNYPRNSPSIDEETEKMSQTL